MKILIVNYEFPPLGGGGGIACFNLARELAKNHQVDYVTTAFKGLPTAETVDGINIFRVPVIGRKQLSTASLLSLVTFFPSSFICGARLCMCRKYDVINSHFVVPSGLSGALLAKIFKKPSVISIYGGDIYDPSKKTSPHRHYLLRKLISWLFCQSEAIIAESNNIRSVAEKFYKPDKRVEIIPVGFVLPVEKSSTRKELGLVDGEIIVISVGRLVKRKGFDIAIRAIASLSKKNVRYVIIGDGPEEESLVTLAKELGIADKVNFKGFLTEEKKYQYLKNSDIYLLTSIHEGFGICLMEAMYAGLPIVATDSGGQTDFMTEGTNALFVPVADISRTADKLTELVDNVVERREMGARNREAIKKLYIENIASRYESVLSRW